MVMRLPPGLYEALVSTGLGDALDGAPGTDVVIRDHLDAAAAHEHLARYFAGELERTPQGDAEGGRSGEAGGAGQ
jgi:hypothetical protein